MPAVNTCECCGHKWPSKPKRKPVRFCSYECRNGTSFTKLMEYAVIPNDPDACWGWLGAKNQEGRSRMSFKLRMWVAARTSWECFNGPIPYGGVACHICDNPECANPKHLFIGTQAENIRDMKTKGRGNHGERAATAIASNEQVIEIKLNSFGKWRIGYINECHLKYGFSKQSLAYMLDGRCWGLVNPEGWTPSVVNGKPPRFGKISDIDVMEIKRLFATHGSIRMIENRYKIHFSKAKEIIFS